MTTSNRNKLILYTALIVVAIINVYLAECILNDSAATKGEDDLYCYVHFLDVGQGDCTLIETHDGRYALIDASTNTAEQDILSYLRDEGVEELEFIIFTHPHEDHIGCGDEIIDNFRVGTIYMTDRTENTACYRNLISSIADSKKRNGTNVINPRKGDTFLLGDIEFLILSDTSKYSDTNNSSICFKMELGESTFIFTGDAEKTVETDILDSFYSLDAEVYKCAHHGSSTSNSDEFLDAISPDISVISCGKGNDYGHPHDEVIKALEKRNIITFRTDTDGNTVIAFSKSNIILPDYQPFQDQTFQVTYYGLNTRLFPSLYRQLFYSSK